LIFSYSGDKTAVLRYVETHDLQASIAAPPEELWRPIAKPRLEDYLNHCDQQTLDLIASFQHAMVGGSGWQDAGCCRAYDAATLFVAGGVAANNELRQSFERDAGREGVAVYFPSRPLSTDNAAMIAAAAYPKFLAKEFAAMVFRRSQD